MTLSSSTANSYICYSLSATPLVVLPYPDNFGGCQNGTLYTGPVAVSSNQTLYATAGVALVAGSWTTGAPSTPTAGAYTISPNPPGQTPGVPANVQGSVVPQ